MNTFCDAVREIIHDIHAHPFNQSLANGTLPQATFKHYIEQDALYLADFSKALAITAGRLSNTQHARAFLHFALSAIQAEQDMHQGYLGNIQAKRQSPACFMYTNYLLKTASLACVEEAVACLLPCFWVYREVGKAIAAHSTPNNPYSDWINLYSSQAFDQSVETMIHITNTLGLSASKTTQDNMHTAFVQSTQLEWLFWDGAFHQTNWRY